LCRVNRHHFEPKTSFREQSAIILHQTHVKRHGSQRRLAMSDKPFARNRWLGGTVPAARSAARWSKLLRWRLVVSVSQYHFWTKPLGGQRAPANEPVPV
jgi:hypothetical protein